MTARAVVARLGHALLNRARTSLEPQPVGRTLGFVGMVWIGGTSEPEPGCVLVDPTGRVGEIHLGPRPELPSTVLVLGGAQHWIVPGVVDAHVHLAFDESARRGHPSGLVTGLVGVRDLGSPLSRARQWQTTRNRSVTAPFVAIAGPVLTNPGGYRSRGWGRDCSTFLTSPDQARATVRQLASDGVDLIKVALDDDDALEPKVLTAVVDSAHRLGLPVVAHALTDDRVRRALHCGVDELAHTPVGRLSETTIDRMVVAGMSVTSTLQTFFSAGYGREAALNATDLVEAGVVLRYGTDLGNIGTRPGVDPRELDRLADTGLGRIGALRAATEHAATAPGIRGASGRIVRGQQASLVLLPASPLDEPGVWRTPAAVFTASRLTVGAVRTPIS